MSVHSIHQLVHGYYRGHEQLAGSIVLQSKESELVTRLSDLSGQLSQGTDVVPYVTGYPLRNKDVYALAKTWPDFDATRAGCVLTHTLLIPKALWRSCETPRRLYNLLQQPTRESLELYASPIEMPETESSSFVDYPRRHTDSERAFVEKYFCEGTKPVVWMGEEEPLDIMTLILRHIWPALRSDISFCTYCLQPRYLGDDLFHIMFAPTSAYSRFHKLQRENIVSRDMLSGLSSGIDNAEPWCSRWTDTLFSETDEQAESIREYISFGPLLGPDPTEIRKLYLLEALQHQLEASPSSIIGLLDIVENLAPAGGQAAEYKDESIRKALNYLARGSESPETFHALAKLGVRISSSPYAALSSNVQAVFVETVTKATRQYPELSLQAFQDNAEELAYSKSLYVSAVANGLESIEDDILPDLEKFPELAPHLIARSPSLAVRYLDSMRGNEKQFGNLVQSLVGWQGNIKSSEERQRLRISLLPRLNTSSVDMLVDYLLQEMAEEDAIACLNVLSNTTDDKLTAGLEKALISYISRVYPKLVRMWASKSVAWRSWIATVVAGSYSADIQGLRDLLADQSLLGQRHAEVLASYVLSLSAQLPYWLKEYIMSDATLIAELIRSTESPSSCMMNALERIASQVTESPLATSSDLTTHILRISSSGVGDRVVKMAMSSALREFGHDSSELEPCKEWAYTEWGIKWLELASLNDLWNPLGLDRNDSAAIERALLWIAQAPDILYGRNHSVLNDIMLRLRPVTQSKQFENQVRCWAQIIQRSSAAAPRRVYLKLCAEALMYAFKNRRVQVSPMIVVAFMPVYNAVTCTEEYPGVIDDLFGFFSWDKGKELRNLLIRSFMDSVWPKGDLAHSVSDRTLLKRVIQRTLRQVGGAQFIEKAIRDLTHRTDVDSSILAQYVKQVYQQRGDWVSWD